MPVGGVLAHGRIVHVTVGAEFHGGLSRVSRRLITGRSRYNMTAHVMTGNAHPRENRAMD